jgi:hypothetical protein
VAPPPSLTLCLSVTSNDDNNDENEDSNDKAKTTSKDNDDDDGSNDERSGSGTTGCQVRQIFFSFSFVFWTYFLILAGANALPNVWEWTYECERRRSGARTEVWAARCAQKKKNRFSLFFFTYFLILTDTDAIPNSCKRPNGDERRRTGWGSDVRVARCA